MIKFIFHIVLKMKFVRCKDLTSNTTGSLLFTLNQAVTLQPKSQVALHSCTIDLVPQILIVDTSNQRIDYSTETNNGAPQFGLIAPGSYTADQLVEQVEIAMNNGLDLSVGAGTFPPVSSGFQWQVVVDQSTQIVTIKFDRSDPETYSTRTTQQCTFDEDTGILTKDTGDPGFSAFSTESQPFIKGAGLTCLYAGDTLSVDTMGCIGIVDVPDNLSGDPADMFMAVWIDLTTGTYFIRRNGVTTDTTVAANDEDVYGIQLDRGELSPCYIRTGGIIALEAPIARDYDVTYYSIVSIDGPLNATVQVGGPTTGITNRYHDNDPYASQAGPSVVSVVELHFEDPDSFGAADLLGFNRALVRSAPITAGEFEASTALFVTKQRLSLIVLLESLPSMESYDSTTHGRRPIVASISAYETKSNTKVEYEPSNLVWLDVNNSMPIDLSVFQFRVLDADDIPMFLANGCCFNLLFR